MVAGSVDVSLDALLMATSEIGSLIADDIVAVVRNSAILLNLRVRDGYRKISIEGFVRVANFT
jgi:hypothetical protein